MEKIMLSREESSKIIKVSVGIYLGMLALVVAIALLVRYG